MRRTWRGIGQFVTAAAVLAMVAGCGVSKQETPDPTGPSELGLSLELFATPDIIPQDGASQSQIRIVARNANGQPFSNVGVRAEIVYDGAIQDFGSLSTKSAVTGGDGSVTISYTAPPGTATGNTDSGDNIVVIRVIPTSTGDPRNPIGQNYANAVSRVVQLRLVPTGKILPPPGSPLATFTFSPDSPTEGAAVQFDASGSRDCPMDAQSAADCQNRGTSSTLVNYAWNFGDGGSGSGVTTSHTYSTAGTYTVRLTVTNTRGGSSSVSKFVTVEGGVAPTADFTFSPTDPAVGEDVFFNASASKAAPGRRIVSYEWTMGDGGVRSGVTVSRRYAAAGTYNVVLTVTDDAGLSASVSKPVTVGDVERPTADFAISPTNPTVNALVNFDAAASRAPAGRTITGWLWNLGDGRVVSGQPRIDHHYTRTGNFTVTLTVTDSSGATATVSKSVTVN